MLPHRLQQIRRVQVCVAFACWDEMDTRPADFWRPPDNRCQWAAACGVLTSLQHLQYARITVLLLCQTEQHRHEDSNAPLLCKILEPLSGVRATVFTVEIAELLEEMRERLGDTPFRLVEREAPVCSIRGLAPSRH